MKHHIERINLKPLLEPFIPLLVNQNWEVREEADCNKRFILGDKQFEYVPTIAGHVPMFQETER